MYHGTSPAEIAVHNGDLVAGPFQPLPVINEWWQTTDNWKSMVMEQDTDVFTLQNCPDEASSCGIYMLFCKDDHLLYIGKASTIYQRICGHTYGKRTGRSAPFASFAFLALPPYAVHDVEVAHIYALRPPWNSLYENIRWAQHDAMVKHIQGQWEPAYELATEGARK